MGILFVYMFKSALCLAAFYMLYKWAMNRDTFHNYNRAVLLGMLVLAAVIPFIKYTVEQTTAVNQPFMAIEDLLMMGAVMVEDDAPATFSITWQHVLLWVYLLGVLVFAVLYGRNIVKMMHLIKTGRQIPDGMGNTITLSSYNIAPFSWMRHIVISQADYEENAQSILCHEQAHIRHHHSWDLVLADAFILLQWFNPAAWLMKRELQTLHEYQADDFVLRQGIDAKRYQLLLIRKAVGTGLYSMANSFNHSSLKKRITMMLKKKSSSWSRAKALLVLPISALAVAAFARPAVTQFVQQIEETPVLPVVHEMPQQQESSALPSKDTNVLPTQEILPQEIQETIPADTIPVKEEVFQVVEQQPEFPGGPQALMGFLAKSIRYPKDAALKGIQGRVIVQFVIKKDGSVTDAVVARSVDPELDAEALRVINAMPAWTPGMQKGQPVSVRYTMPITFRLTDPVVTDAPKKEAEDDVTKISVKSNGGNVLYIVDDKVVEDMSKYTPDNIESIEVIKNPEKMAATLKEYGVNRELKGETLMLIRLKK